MYTIQAPLWQHQDNVHLGAMDLNSSTGKLAFAVGVGLPSLVIGGLIGFMATLAVCEKAVRMRDEQWRSRNV